MQYVIREDGPYRVHQCISCGAANRDAVMVCRHRYVDVVGVRSGGVREDVYVVVKSIR